MQKKSKSKRWLVVEIIAIISFIVIGALIVWRGNPFSSPEPSTQQELLQEARHYFKLEGGKVQCQLCFRSCVISEGQRGYCETRENRGGKLYTLTYGMPAAIQIDPIEKKPLFHFLPGSETLSFGTAGCNFKCIFCQNWHLAARTPEEVESIYLSPKEAVKKALDYNCQSISFTYNEPTVFYEWMYDVAKLAKENGLNTLFHTNGSMQPQPLRELLKYMDAVCVDLKAFTAEFYYLTSFSQLEPVLTTLKIIKEEGVWLEITNLIIPTLNDDPEKIEEMCIWIRDNLGKDVPIHFSRFFPAYKLTRLPPTPIETLEKAKDIAQGVGLQYVTIGNVPGHPANSTYCPQCGKVLIERIHFSVLINNIENGKCRFCGHQISGVWE